MAPEAEPESGRRRVKRAFEQPPDAITCYSDHAQVTGTAHEVVMQFYETIPGVPVDGEIKTVKARLRATIIVSKAHAANIGRLLLTHIGGDSEA